MPAPPGPVPRVVEHSLLKAEARDGEIHLNYTYGWRMTAVYSVSTGKKVFYLVRRTE